MRPMVRTPEEFPKALAQKIEQNGGKKAVAKKLGVTEGALNYWLQGTIPNRPNREKIRKLLNIEIIFMERLTDKEAVAVNTVVNEQMVMDLDETYGEDEEEAMISTGWINLYRTPNPGIFKGKYGNLQLVLVKQKFEEKADKVPFVMVVTATE